MCAACSRSAWLLALMTSRVGSLITPARARPLAPFGFCRSPALDRFVITSHPPRTSGPTSCDRRAGSWLRGSRYVDFISRHDRPGDARRLVGKRDRHDLRGLVLEQLRGPATVSCVLARHAHHGRGADDQQAADVAITLLADAGLPLATAAAVSARREPEPGGKLSSRSEERGVRNSGGDCARRDRADARDRRKPTACRVSSVAGEDLWLAALDLTSERAELGRHSLQRRSRQWRQRSLRLMQHRYEGADTAWPLGCDDAVLGKMPTKCGDQHRPLSDQEITRLVQHQHSLLVDRLYGNEPHRRSRRRLGNRLGVCRIGLAALHIRLHIGRRHQPDLMSACDQFTRPVMGRRARLHTDQTRREDAEELQHLATTQLPADHNLAVSINCMNLKYALREVETHNRNRLHVRLL